MQQMSSSGTGGIRVNFSGEPFITLPVIDSHYSLLTFAINIFTVTLNHSMLLST